MRDCKPAVTPGVEQKWDPVDMDFLTGAEASVFRRCMGIINYLVMGRADIAYIVNELGRKQTEPVVGQPWACNGLPGTWPGPETT